ncbi:glutamate--tRNA ligase family protein [Peijinzhouia sedimentorum]
MLISRIAPTPSGYLHLGNLLSFLQTWLIVRRHSGKLMLRIDDHDALRAKDEYLNDIFDSLSFLGIDYDIGPRNLYELKNEYSQHLRKHTYQEVIDRLKAQGNLYACTCSRKVISAENSYGLYPRYCREKGITLNRPNVALRIRLPMDLYITIKDDILTKEIEVQLFDVMPDFVVRRKDSLPAYQIASLVDDEIFGVNYIVRGKDLVESTAAQMYLSEMLYYNFHLSCRFFHHELLRGEGELKLSKSAGAYSLFQMRKEGFRKEEILGILGSYLGFEKREVESPQWFLDNFDKIIWK